MRVHVDEARSYGEAGGVDRASGRLALEVADRGDGVAGDPEIGGRAGAPVPSTIWPPAILMSSIAWRMLPEPRPAVHRWSSASGARVDGASRLTPPGRSRSCALVQSPMTMPRFPMTDSARVVDIAIVGGGIVGASCAYFLAERGADVLLLGPAASAARPPASTRAACGSRAVRCPRCRSRSRRSRCGPISIGGSRRASSTSAAATFASPRRKATSRACGPSPSASGARGSARMGRQRRSALARARALARRSRGHVLRHGGPGQPAARGAYVRPSRPRPRRGRVGGVPGGGHRARRRGLRAPYGQWARPRRPARPRGRRLDAALVAGARRATADRAPRASDAGDGAVAAAARRRAARGQPQAQHEADAERRSADRRRQAWLGRPRHARARARRSRTSRSARSTRSRSCPSCGDRDDASWVGLEGLTPDEMPIIDCLDDGRAYVAAGFCGHGFAIGPVVGRLLAEWLLDGRPSLDVSAFRRDRFRRRPERSR